MVFPDLNGLATFGDNLSEALLMAQKACSLYLFTSLRDREKLPEPTSLEKDDEKAIMNLILVNLDEFARLYGDKAVKKTLSIPAWLNTACEELNINYSKVLKEALIAKIQKK